MDIAIAATPSAVPAINGPRVVGATAGTPFLFRIPATGRGPLSFAAEELPRGLTLNPQTGIITGALDSEGTTRFIVTVSGPAGVATRALTVVAGQRMLALTPPMGWNSWNVWGTSVDDAKVRSAADWMVRSGLAAHGYQYVNVDDAWEGERDADGRIQPNEKFPDMRALADYVHGLGLKLGIYSSPGPKTCGGYEGSYQHEFQDAQTWAEWGIDYLKHDYCSYLNIQPESSIAAFKEPYALMREALDACGRDIVFSICWGGGSSWRWGREVGGNLWRTTDDIFDEWDRMASIGFDQQKGLERFSGPGYWNDPDMLVVGRLGWGPDLRDTRLTQDEQITHITLWCLLAAPLLLGCDLSQLDAFTLALLTNDEVLAVDQDPLGVQATRRSKQGHLEVWARPLWDGTTAVGLFNRGPDTAIARIDWKDIEIEGTQPVRDLWRRSDAGAYDAGYAAEVASHACVLLKVGTPSGAD